MSTSNAQEKYAILITVNYYDLPNPPQWNGDMTDDFLAEKINQINCNKRVFWMQGDRSCIMLNELQGINTVFNTASSASQVCFPADDIPVTENEVYMVNSQPVPYHHGEFDLSV